MGELMAAEFKGTYRAPHPGGIKDQNVLKEFHVRVKMKKTFLEAPGLNGLFKVHYEGFLKKLYPEMIAIYRFDLVQATELDGRVIPNPKALSYDGLIEYIRARGYKINFSLYSPLQLRDEVVLYEHDKDGQQKLQRTLEERRGGQIAIANELAAIDDLIEIVGAVRETYGRSPVMEALPPVQPVVSAPTETVPALPPADPWQQSEGTTEQDLEKPTLVDPPSLDPAMFLQPTAASASAKTGRPPKKGA